MENEQWKPYRKWTATKILELGEYSMFVNTIIPDISVFRICGKYNVEHWAKEVIASEKGCIAYFDERIDTSFEEGSIYSLYISNAHDTYWAVADSLFGISLIDPTRTLSLIPLHMEWDFSANYKDYWEEYWKWQNQKKKTFIVSDVNDYSMFINKNLKDILRFRIRTKHSSWYEPTQIVSTEAGSVLYFNECIKDIFKKGCIYPARVVMKFSWYYSKKKLQQLI